MEVRDHTARFSLLADRHDHAPYGLAGGEPGERGAAYRFDLDDESAETDGTGESDDDAEKLPQKSVHDLPAGSVVSVRTPGAGGYGDPADRDPAAVARDLRLGKATPEFVREHYDVDLDDFDIDSDESDSDRA